MARSDFDFSCPFRVRFAEVDMHGHVFNANYLVYFDSAITEFLRQLDLDLPGVADSAGCRLLVARTTVEYRAPVYFDELIDVLVRFVRVGESSLTFGLEVHPAGRDEVRANGEVVWVCVDREARRPRPLPAAFRARAAGGSARRAKAASPPPA